MNFWQPGGNVAFKALAPGELFLFKLHSPRNYIVGGGVFYRSLFLPVSMAWKAFGELNGSRSLEDLQAAIAKYRRDRNPYQDFRIGCRVLVQPFFLPENLWRTVPTDWSPTIVSGKGYSTDDSVGADLWNWAYNLLSESSLEGLGEAATTPRYGAPTLVRPRLGQGAFRVGVTEAYSRRCAITSEKVLPALEAAHIKPYSKGGKHEVENGLLLRRDLHTLFDHGYVTVAPDSRFEVSRRIKEEYENGRDYYAMHGKNIHLPPDPKLQPSMENLRWHNSVKYNG